MQFCRKTFFTRIWKIVFHSQVELYIGLVYPVDEYVKFFVDCYVLVLTYKSSCVYFVN